MDNFNKKNKDEKKDDEDKIKGNGEKKKDIKKQPSDNLNKKNKDEKKGDGDIKKDPKKQPKNNFNKKNKDKKTPSIRVENNNSRYFSRTEAKKVLGMKKGKFDRWFTKGYLNRDYSEREYLFHTMDLFMSLLLEFMTEFIPLQSARPVFYRIERWFKENLPSKDMVLFFNKKEFFILQGRLSGENLPTKEFFSIKISKISDHIIRAMEELKKQH